MWSVAYVREDRKLEITEWYDRQIGILRSNCKVIEKEYSGQVGKKRVLSSCPKPVAVQQVHLQQVYGWDQHGWSHDQLLQNCIKDQEWW